MQIRTVLLTGLLSLPYPAAAVTQADFLASSSRDLLTLCSAAPSDPLYREAVHFCHGYLVGAYHYMQAVTNGPGAVKLVCFDNPPPSRNQAIDRFIEWLRQNPQYQAELPVETMLRHLQTTYPCSN